MPAIDNLVLQTSSATGTGAKALVAADGFRTFMDAFGAGGVSTFYYFIRHKTLAENEWGEGHLDTNGALVADVVISGSGGAGVAVNFSVGDKEVVCDLPAERVVRALTDLTNVDIGSPADGDGLHYDGATQKWMPFGDQDYGLITNATSVTRDYGGLL